MNAFEEEESIYNLVPKPPPVIVKGPLYVSRFDGLTPSVTVKPAQHATMGRPASMIRSDPKDFLRKHSVCRDLPPPPAARPLVKPAVRLPQVSRSAELPPRNFILEEWRSAPKTRRLHPEAPPTFYVDKPDFGRVPRYLNRVTRQAAAESAYWEGVRQANMPEDTETRCRLLGEDERLEILAGLQANLADAKRRYGALSFGQDHISFRKRKEKLEADLAQLEADIATFSRQNIYITET
jgi:hypothetical protein